MTPEVAVVITVTISEHLILQNMVQNYSYELSYLILKKKKLSNICVILVLHVGK